ncbi:MAG: zinc-dependent peptidase [Ferruginibacter sp.]
MPQDTVYYNDGTTVEYYSGYDSLPENVKHIIDSISGRTSVIVDPEFKKKQESYSEMALPLTLLLLAVTWLLVKYFSTNPLHLKLEEIPSSATTMSVIGNVCLTYKGADLSLPEEIIRGILLKRFPYFNGLGPGGQRRFLMRHKRFMQDKIFKIHDAKGFREMPVLVSAAAIQLSFGLEEYMLPFYKYINIFPQEFIRTGPDICFLQGNVSGNNIKISWKHFLEGYALPDNGENVGLHEMAHAYYCQNFVCGDDTDRNFTKGYPAFISSGEKAFKAEKNSTTDFYSDYALRNFQEFWAESVERFFERPAEMKQFYPDVYDSLSGLLNQAP